MKSTTSFKDFKDLSTIKPKKSMHPQVFDLDDEDPELDLSTWTTIQVPKGLEGRYQKLQPGEISVRLQMPSAQRKASKLAGAAIVEATEMYIRFGAKVIKQLGWRQGEHIAVRQHPQDKSVYGLMPQPNGRKLRLESAKGSLLYMAFAFTNEQKLLTGKSQIVEFSIHENGYLLFRLPPQDNS